MTSTLLDKGAENRIALYEATSRSLQAAPKELPAVWLYDDRGSRLYEEITRLPEYYLPRRESEILRAHGPEIARLTGADTLAELGAGSANNTRLILDAIGATVERFVPLDVSGQALEASAETIAAAYPRVAVQAIVGDFERDLGLLPRGGRRLIAFLGSTIGNLYPDQRAELLAALARELWPGDSLLLGVDLVKDAARLRAAYNDPRGVTEAFVRNALTAADRELEATFDQQLFAYEARWDPEHERMDVGFRAQEAQAVSVRRLGLELTFEHGEQLRVEISSKFRREGFEQELAGAGLLVESWWTDQAGDFAVVLVRRDPIAGS